MKHGIVSDVEVATASARKGYEGLIQIIQWDEQDRLILPDICIGTSAGDYESYVTRPKVKNDLHGVGALVMACVEMESLIQG
ncbi:Unsaturated rhamnogalacturonyl hydrolase YteR [compost metagenome]